MRLVINSVDVTPPRRLDLALISEVGQSADWLGAELKKLGLDSTRINAECQAFGTECANAFFDDNRQPQQIAETRLANIKQNLQC